MICIVDYGMGNLRSVEKAFAFLGKEVAVSPEPADVLAASGVVLPGVGAFGDAMRELEERKLADPLRRAIDGGVPFLGICLGLQLLFEESEESPGVRGLGILPGRVARFPSRVKVPHMGWNDIRVLRDHPVLEGLAEGSYFYFVHSYYVIPERDEHRLTLTQYGEEFVSGVADGNLVAFQFHPEKSSEAGLRLLENFASQCA
ncbi:MAG: imidazole glycerol phosphate synthase subunit HisH [Actinomycetota bacterium]|nr:imidazole glycerol phosphate synthase subunit HisH [Actinomycetota bacterium]